MKKLSALLLTAALLLSLCACVANEPIQTIPTPESTRSPIIEEDSKEVIVPATEPSETEAAIDYENLVYDGLAEEGENPYGGTVTYVVPQIDLDDPGIDAINRQIMEETSALIYANEDNPEYSVIDYEWGCYGDILSIVVHSEHFHYAWPEFYVYNISLERCELVDDETVLAAFGLDYNDYLTDVQKSLAAQWLRRAEQAAEVTVIDPRTDAFAARQYQNSLTLQNVTDSTPFVSRDGSLQTVVMNYSIAGADAYWGKYPVGTDYELPGDWTVLGRWAVNEGGT